MNTQTYIKALKDDDGFVDLEEIRMNNFKRTIKYNVNGTFEFETFRIIFTSLMRLYRTNMNVNGRKNHKSNFTLFTFDANSKHRALVERFYDIMFRLRKFAQQRTIIGTHFVLRSLFFFSFSP